MITEDYCSPEVAKLLDEKGFNEYCFALYDSNKILIHSGIRLNNIQVGRVEGSYSAPTHQMAMKWLRKKGVIIVIQPEYFNAESKCSAWGCDIWVNDNYKKVQGDFPSYEEAIDAALKYSLENLI